MRAVFAFESINQSQSIRRYVIDEKWKTHYSVDKHFDMYEVTLSNDLITRDVFRCETAIGRAISQFIIKYVAQTLWYVNINEKWV